MAGTVISRGLMLCASILVARMLGKTGFGELGMIQSTVGMFGVFAGFGLGLTATKHVAEFRDSDPERAGRVIGIAGFFAVCTGGLLSLGLFFFAPWLAEHTINAPHLSGVLRIGALVLFVNALNGAQTGALAGFEAFRTIARVNLIVGLISFPILVTGAYVGGLSGAVWALAINLCFNWLFNHLAVRREARRFGVLFSVRGSSREWRLLRGFALPAALSGMLVGPANWICRAILVNEPGGYEEMAMLTAAVVFQTLLLFVTGTISSPLLSMVSNAGKAISDKLGTVNILSTWVVGTFVAIPLLCFPEVAQLAFGNEYATRDFQVTFALVVFATSIMAFKNGLAVILAVNSLLWWGFLSNSLWALVLVISTFFLSSWGAPGLAAAIVIAYVVNTVVVVPLYYSRSLVPRKTLVSLESGVIWTVMLCLLLLNIFGASIQLRCGLLLPSLLLVFMNFRRIWLNVEN